MTEELVIMRDRQAVTTSLQVAQNFEKRHVHILRDIDAFNRMERQLQLELQQEIQMANSQLAIV